MSVRVLLIDDHKITRVGIANIFEGTEFLVAGEAELTDHAIDLLNREPFDLVIMESRLNGQDALPCLQQVKLEWPTIPVLIYSAFDNPVQVSQSNMLGAVGYLRKEIPGPDLLDACYRATNGESLWTSEMLRRVSVSSNDMQIGNELEIQLTSRELQVLTQLCEGATNKEIASALEISYETVKEHVQNVLKKLCVSDRTQAAIWAVRHGIV